MIKKIKNKVDEWANSKTQEEFNDILYNSFSITFIVIIFIVVGIVEGSWDYSNKKYLKSIDNW